uniref:Solute carrier family 26, member 11 n=1 Tax=Nothobranchius korthausae TaxID=1143690 RepID=A0A1A8F1X7_9TELE
MDDDQRSESWRRCCSYRTLKSWLPIFCWLPKYNLTHLKMDLLAGLTVGLTTVPQALAYAEVAGLPVQYGLYSAFMGGFIYTLLGTSKDVTLGPTAIMSFLCSSVVGGQPHRAVLLSLLCGIIQALMALLRLGFLLDFISYPVIKGFTCAAAVTIGFGQVKNILGIHGVPQQFFLEIYYTFYRIPEARVGDVVLGLVCLAVLVVFMLMKSHPIHNDGSTYSSVVRKLVWTVATMRNALVVVAASLVAFSWEAYGHHVFTITGHTSQGLPPFSPPPTSDTTPNGTAVPFGKIVEVRERREQEQPFSLPLMCPVALPLCVLGFWRRAGCDSSHGSVGEHHHRKSFCQSEPLQDRCKPGAAGHRCDQRHGLVCVGVSRHRQLWKDSSELSDGGLHSSRWNRHQCDRVAVFGVSHASVLLHPQSFSCCSYHLCRSSHGGPPCCSKDVEDTQAGSAAVWRDVPVVFLGDAVRHHGRCSCFWSPAAVRHGPTQSEGVG